MPNCAAFSCTNRLVKNRHYYFDKQLRTRWLNNIKRDGELSKNNSFYICSEHFEDECFERELKVGFKFGFYLVRMGYYNTENIVIAVIVFFHRKSLWRIRRVQDG